MPDFSPPVNAHPAGRFAIIGNSGSGKSTLAKQLAAHYTATLLDLDTIAFEPGKIAVPRAAELAVAEVAAFCGQHERWVMEGCYENLIAASLRFAPTLLFLEPGMAVCQQHCRARPWEAHKYTSKAAQDEKLDFLLAWVADYYVRDGAWSLGAHQALFDSYSGPKHKISAPIAAADLNTLSG